MARIRSQDPTRRSPAACACHIPLLLDLGGRARGWLGPRPLGQERIVTVEPVAGDPTRRARTAGAGDVVRADPERLPFPDATFAAVVVAGTLEHARDDLDTLDEIARVLRPGGKLLLRTPRAGRLTWLDPFNIYHYASDATGRGPRPFEVGELGWRRHYRREEIVDLLKARGFIVQRTGGAGLGLAEALTTLILLVCRLALHSPRAERLARCLLQPLLRAEGDLPAGRLGYDLIVEAERRATSAG